MRQPFILLAITCLVVSLLAAGTACAAEPADTAEAQQQANADLDTMARELAKLAATPGFRGFVRSEIAKSKNRESILELDRFLERAARKRGAPPGLSKFREFSAQAQRRLRSGGAAFKGYDLYIPVEAHRAKWRGGDDFVVAFGPYGDDQRIQQIFAYSVRNGERVVLDAQRPPEMVVLMLVPDEHETHEVSGAAPPVTDQDRTLARPDVVGKDIAEKPVPQESGNSYVGVRRLYIRDVKEPWWLGQPEIRMYIAQRKNNYCVVAAPTEYSELKWYDNARTWRTTWSPQQQANNDYCRPNNNQENTYLETGKRTCSYFGSGYYNKLYIRIYEADSLLEGVGSYFRPYLYTIYSNVTCQINRWSADDYIDHGTTYRNNFDYAADYKHDMGNAYIYWHKVH